MNRTICVVTGSRSEYGLLLPLMKRILEDNDLCLQIIATGMHLSNEFGLTYREIENDGFFINEKIETLLAADTPTGIIKSMGLGLIGFADAFNRLKPDILVVLGDRYEIMVAVQAAMIYSIPIAHIHGGEITEGAIDDSIRHAISKMSHLHFVSTSAYRDRVIQLGEQPERVFNVGAIGVDNIIELELLDRQKFEESIQFTLGEQNFLITYHPVTLSDSNSDMLITELLAALDCFPEARIVFTKPNSDADGRIISQKIDEYVQRNTERAISFTSLGQLRYLSALQHMDVIIGNSSSGIIEVPLFNKPTVNIGSRQTGRIKGPSVIDCGESRKDIAEAIVQAISGSFREGNTKANLSLYGNGNTSARIKDVLKCVNVKGIVRKKFHDIHPNRGEE
ncbi:UDP-N-acetylglucosamine 2-epimerase [Paenibacillus riograndensis]|uniref:UDP-N-acetylglucosamine 2-epimerase n=1 Tax=Paenibacillus riograndensis TaxID=483937 RepID=A0A132TR47_9BACL|nr:UDP-N-acetylglucosamine 2-epimerase [Paenibacillus riograndensis]KWX73799.1 UDP-N-acetylglucosamine 2-epimerase [Paenibacillus riograndensis]KWX88726.1 UDP-N-acetylglucosamine 2-epimerase [Paenibacillus riograndensis]